MDIAPNGAADRRRDIGKFLEAGEGVIDGLADKERKGGAGGDSNSVAVVKFS